MRPAPNLCCFCDMPWDDRSHAKCGMGLLASFRKQAEAEAQSARQSARRQKMAEKHAQKGRR